MPHDQFVQLLHVALFLALLLGVVYLWVALDGERRHRREAESKLRELSEQAAQTRGRFEFVERQLLALAAEVDQTQQVMSRLADAALASHESERGHRADKSTVAEAESGRTRYERV